MNSAPRRCVVIFPGYGGFRISVKKLKERFQKHGFDVVVMDYERFGTDSIQDIARKSLPLLEKIRPAYDHVVFVGHSMGGLVVRWLLQVENKTYPVSLADSCICIAAPHEGSRWANLDVFGVCARIFGTRSAVQMKMGSRFLRYLNSLPWPAYIPCLYVSGDRDFLVRNEKNPHGELIRIDKRGHTGLVFCSQTFYEMWSWLTFTLFEESGPLERQGLASWVKSS